MKRTLFVVLSLFCLAASAQKKGQARIDSLIASLPSTGTDTARMKTLMDIANSYSNSNPSEGMRYAEQAIALGEKSRPAMLADAYNVMGVCLKVKSDYPRALEYHAKALAFAQERNDQRAIASTLGNMGSCYLYQGLYSKGLSSYLDALAIFEKLKNKAGMATVIGNIGSVYSYLKEYDKAIDYYERSLRLHEEMGNKNGIAMNTANAGYVYLYKGEMDKALQYIRRAMKVSEELGNTNSVATNSQGIGRVYQAQHKYLEAVENYTKALELSEKVGNKSMTAQNLLTTAEVYLMVVKDSVTSPFTGELSGYKGLLSKALVLAERAIALRKESKDLNGLNFAYDTKSEIESYAGNAVAALQSYQEHIRYRDSVFNIEKTKEINRRELQYEFGKREDSLRYEQALTSQRLERQQLLGKQQEQALQLVSKEKDLQRLTYLQAQAKLQREKEIQSVLLDKSQLEATLSRQASDKRIQEQQLQIRFDRKVKIYLGIAVALILLIAFLVYYNQQRTQRLNRIIGRQKEELEELGAVKDKLFSMVGHDMRAPVNTLLSFIDLLEDEAISQDRLQAYAGELKNQLSHTSVLMENLLNWASSQLKGFTPLIETLDVKEMTAQTIALLQQQAAHKNIRILDHTPLGVRIRADRNMLALVVRNLLSNAIKFTPPGGEVAVTVTGKDNVVSISVADTGTGMPAAKLHDINDTRYLTAIDTRKGTQGETGTGLGLMLCKTFATLMHGSVHAASTEGEGSTVTVTLPAAA